MKYYDIDMKVDTVDIDTKVDTVSVLRNFTIEVEIRRVSQTRFRIWIAFQIMRFAAWIGNMGLTKKEFIGVIVEDEGIVK